MLERVQLLSISSLRVLPIPDFTAADSLMHCARNYFRNRFGLALTSNTSLTLALKNKSLAELDLSVLNAQWYPQISVTQSNGVRRRRPGVVPFGYVLGINRYHGIY